MGSITNYLTTGLKKLWNFFNPGYILRIIASDIDEVAFNRVNEIIKNNGFIFVGDGDSIVRGSIVSEYTRKRNYLISITLIHTKLQYPERRLNLSIEIVNEYKGSKPPIMADINELGESLYEEISQFTGKDKLTMKAWRTPIPSV
jgi:hypothetical protein